MASTLLDAYLTRVGLPAAGDPDLAALRRLHAAHVNAIPFENLDILLGRGVRLDLDALRGKLIAQKRGGYCFEHNTLFLAVLQEVGFTAVPLEARVRGGGVLRPRTHMVIGVDIGGQAWLADVGFGGEGPREPVLMRGEETTASSGLAYRIVQDDDALVLQMRRDTAWSDQYAFLTRPVHPVDFEVANWYTSTHPTSPFVRTLTAQRTTRDVRYLLRYPTYTEIRAADTRTHDITREELLPLLRNVFLIDLPNDTVFPAIDSSEPRRASSL